MKLDNRNALSIAETLIILAVLAVIVGLALPKLDRTSFIADVNVRVVRTALGEASKLSFDGGHNVLLSFDTTAGRIRLAVDANGNRAVDGEEHAEWRGLPDGARFASTERSIDGLPAVAVSGSDLITVDGMPTLVFRTGGIPSSSLEVYTRARGDSRATRAVRVTATTGEVRGYAASDAGWKAGK